MLSLILVTLRDTMVYVDDMFAPFGRMLMCHMIATTTDELHTMAARIGVARKWYQGDHYDVAKSTRLKAIGLGAQPITMRDLVCMNSFRHWTGNDQCPLLTPDEGERFIRANLGL